MAYGTPTSSSFPSSWLYSPYYPIVYEVAWAGLSTSDPITNVRMDAQVYVGTSNTLYGTITKKSISSGGSDIFRFNVSNLLKTALSHEFINLPITSDGITSSSEEKMATTYIVYFTARYTDVNGVEQSEGGLNSGARWTGNYVVDRYFGLDHHLGDGNYFFSTNENRLISSSTDKFLTYAPQNKVIRRGEDEQLSFFYWGSNQLELNYQTYDLGGNSNTAQTFSLTTINNKAGHFTISDNGSNTIIDDFDNISKVDVWLEDSAATQVTEKKTYLINQGCEDGYRLWWGNSLGGVDKYTFNKYKNKNLNVKQRINYTPAADSTPSILERKGTTLKAVSNHSFTGVSDFITDDWSRFFEDLFNSPDVYFQPYVDGDYIDLLSPVLITSKEFSSEDSDGLRQVIIEFEYAENIKTLES